MRIFVAGLALSCLSCSLVVPADAVQCNVSGDCVARGFAEDTICEERFCVPPAIDPVWGCLGQVEEPLTVIGATHSQSIVIVNAITDRLPPGLAVRVCSGVDLDCAAPIEEGLVPDAEGVIHYTVPSGFVGYLEVTATDIVPSIVQVGPIVTDGDVGVKIQLAPTFVVEGLFSQAGVPNELTQGSTLNLLASCDGLGRTGISFTHDSTGVPFFLHSLSVNVMASVSDESGQSGVLNVEPGFITITSTRAETGEFIGRARGLVRAGWLTYIAVVPSPAG